MIFNRLRELREEKDLSQDDLAKILNISRSNIGKYENGKLDLNTDIIIKYAQYFNVNAHYLLGLTNIRTNDFTVNNQEIGLGGDIKNLSDEKLRKIMEIARLAGLLDE